MTPSFCSSFFEVHKMLPNEFSCCGDIFVNSIVQEHTSLTEDGGGGSFDPDSPTLSMIHFKYAEGWTIYSI